MGLLDKMYKVKIALVGPCQSGKTMIANLLADATENIGGEYRPTAGVRILEFESGNLSVNNKNIKAEVELWDSSGSNQFESCWPAIQRDAHGIIFVFNPESSAQAKQLESFHQAFVRGPTVTENSCVVFAHFLSLSRDRRGAKLPNTFSRIPQLEVNLEEEGNRLRSDFQTFLSTVIAGLSHNRDQEEINIINSR